MYNIKLINRLSYLITITAVIVITVSLVYYMLINYFAIKHIVIVGDIQHINTTELNYIANNRLRGNLFTLDINGLQYEFHKIPWVDRVFVSRSFPHSIVVGISEYKALARYANLGLITPNGQIFNGSDDNINLPMFNVPSDKITDTIALYYQAESIFENKQYNLSQINMPESGVVVMRLIPATLSNNTNSNELDITMCGTNFTEQLKTLDAYWNQLLTISPKLQAINMCYKNALAIHGDIQHAHTSH